MKLSQKKAQTLQNRVKAWRDLSAMGSHGEGTKLVRRHDGHGTQAFHCPGSQNGRK